MPPVPDERRISGFCNAWKGCIFGLWQSLVTIFNQSAHAMIVYKHVDPKHLTSFLCGDSIQLCTYGYYRDWEDKRADREEGLIIHEINGSVEEESEAALNLEKLHFFNGNLVTGVRYINCKATERAPEHLIFCSSLEPDFKYCRTNKKVVVQLDAAELVRQILEADPTLASCAMGSVSYDKQHGDALKEINSFDPFKKPKKFDWENEYRILFYGRESTRRQVRLRLPHMSQFMKLISIPPEIS